MIVQEPVALKFTCSDEVELNMPQIDGNLMAWH